jgi:hypothetical protein
MKCSLSKALQIMLECATMALMREAASSGGSRSSRMSRSILLMNRHGFTCSPARGMWWLCCVSGPL